MFSFSTSAGRSRLRHRGPPGTPSSVVLLAGLLIAATGVGCGILRKPDLTDTTAIADLREPQRPLILIHGFLGAKLRDAETHRVRWGNMTSILTGFGRDDLALATDPGETDVPGENLEAFRIYDELWGVRYYATILRALEEAGGYRIGDIENPEPGDTAFVFVYDWRRDIVDSSRRLGEAIERIQSRLDLPGTRFDLLAHSQGGLVARYYVKYGTAGLDEIGDPPRPTLAGAANVNKVILLGTPNEGCLKALKVLHLGVKKVFNPIRPEEVFTMPSVYQMLPPRDVPVFVDLEGNELDLDLYDPAIWVEHGWSVFSPKVQARLRRKLVGSRGDPEVLERRNRDLVAFLGRMLRRAERFRAALDAPAGDAPGPAYYAFGSDCVPTLRAAAVYEIAGRQKILFSNDGRLGKEVGGKLTEALYGPGDGLVLMESLLALSPANRRGRRPTASGKPAFDSAFFVCQNHGILPSDPIFQNNLFYTLLWAENRSDPVDAEPWTASVRSLGATATSRKSD